MLGLCREVRAPDSKGRSNDFPDAEAVPDHEVRGNKDRRAARLAGAPPRALSGFLARRLAVIMHRIWVDGTEFRWTREQATAAAAAA